MNDPNAYNDAEAVQGGTIAPQGGSSHFTVTNPDGTQQDIYVSPQDPGLYGNCTRTFNDQTHAGSVSCSVGISAAGMQVIMGEINGAVNAVANAVWSGLKAVGNALDSALGSIADSIGNWIGGSDDGGIDEGSRGVGPSAIPPIIQHAPAYAPSSAGYLSSSLHPAGMGLVHPGIALSV